MVVEQLKGKKKQLHKNVSAKKRETLKNTKMLFFGPGAEEGAVI